MADTKTTALTEVTAPIATDILYMVDDPGVTPLSRKVQFANLMKAAQNQYFMAAATELTVAAGVITVTQAAHKLQPASGTADDLDTISGTAEGEYFLLYVTDEGTDTITLKHGTGNLSCPGGNDVVLSDGMVICYSDSTTVYVTGGAPSSPTTMGGRISLTTAVPVTTADVTAATSLYWVPHGIGGGVCSLFDGSNWQHKLLTELTDTNAGFTASKPHDIFIDWNAGTPQLDKVVWTDGTTRATALAVQDGRYVLTGALDWNYLGTVYADASSQFNDALKQRFVWNYYNRVSRLLDVSDATANWTYATVAWRIMRGQAANKSEFVVGVAEDAIRIVQSQYVSATAVTPYIGIGYDSVTVPSKQVGGIADGYAAMAVSYGFTPAAGYHYVAPLEYVNTTANGTFIGADSQAFTGVFYA